MDGIGNWIKIIAGAGSGEGIAIALGEHHRVAVVFDELRRFEKKAGIDGSVLVSIANEMFDRNTYANVTKTGKLEVSNGHLGLLSNTTDETFQQLLNASEMVDIGFMNRLVLVPGESGDDDALGAGLSRGHQAAEALLSRPAWVPPLLDAVEARTISRGEIPLNRKSFLLRHRDEKVRTRAARVYFWSEGSR